MEKHFVPMKDGKKIYVEVYSRGHKNNLLMLHGGPGEGCGDFQYQAIKLSQFFNVIIFDQRGVLRSDKIEDNEQFGLDNLVDDCESLKNAMSIDSWHILGHSFGGEIALLYATKYPQSVEKVIFENPTFYYPKAIKGFYKKCVLIAKEKGDFECARELDEFSNNTNNVKVLAAGMRKIPIDIIIKADHKSETSADIDTVNCLKGITEEQWGKSKIHFDKLQEEGKMNQNFIPLISQMKSPSLLILGEYDSFSLTEQNEFYANEAFDGKIVIFDKSGHRPHDEEPDKFAETVIEFLRD